MFLNRLIVRFSSSGLSITPTDPLWLPKVCNAPLFAGTFLFFFSLFLRLSRFVYINCTARLFLKVDLNDTICIMQLDRK